VARTKKVRSTPPADKSAPANRSGTGAKPRGPPFKPGQSGNPSTRFVPGQSGNPSGRPKDVLGIQRLALEMCPEALEKLAKLVREAESERAQADAASKISIAAAASPRSRSTSGMT
jgi:Family of unknown function (DUF5681)